MSQEILYRRERLDACLAEEIGAFPGKVSLLAANLATGETLHAFAPESRVVSASTIKVPILLAALEAAHRGELDLDAEIFLPPETVLEDTAVFELGRESYPLRELLYWMTVESDNTATNRVIDLLGFEAVNRFCTRLNLRQTTLERKMLDWSAVAAGRNNYTSAADQCRLYAAMLSGEALSASAGKLALRFLRRQRSMDCFLRYISDEVSLAHKTGTLDYAQHDAGVFFLPEFPLYLGVFTWDGPSPEGDHTQKRLLGRLAKAIYDTYRGTGKEF